jgi:hypothetical protein
MSIITLRLGKGSPLTNDEVDANFTNLNTDKVEKTAAAITGGTIDNTVIGGTTPAAGTFTTLTATGTSYLGGSSTSRNVQVDPVAGGTTTYTQFTRNAGINEQQIVAANIAKLGLISTGGVTINFYTASNNTQKQLVVANTNSAVNYVQVTGAATGSAAQISAQGSDATIALQYNSKSATGQHIFTAASLNAFRILPVSSAVNYATVSNSATTFSPIFSVAGTDTNISQVFQSKGTGAIDLAAGSSGVNISNGGTVTAITRTSPGGSYTSAPTPAISAPTTAGGVQATATCTIGVATSAVSSGGTGYTLNDVLTFSGGTFTAAATATVSAVSGGVITAITMTSGGTYTVAPTNPVSVTGGTGTSATFTLGWGINSTFTITAAGSGYVEQPTVSFSSGGGSGAAAYATVGSGTVVRSLGSTLDFYTPNQQIAFRVNDYANQAGSGYWQAYGGNPAPILRANGTTAGQIQTNSAVPIQFQTNNAFEQFRIAHTASAVNYVQVTGAATGGRVTLSSQGSDGNIGTNYQTKGNGQHIFYTSAGGSVAFVINGTGTANYIQTNNAAAGSAPSFQVAGIDTNIDLTLTPKGTGVVKAGTNTVLDAGNYNSYAPTLTGTGASGTWGISITGNAATVTSVTSSQVTTALGFTPYNATNPSGYVNTAGARAAISVTGSGSYDSATGIITVTGGVTSVNSRTGAVTISSADVTGALGFTPYNATNPTGYITSSALSSYLPLSGGTVTGTTRIGNLSIGYGTYLNSIRPTGDTNLNLDTPSGATYATNILIGASFYQVLHAGNYNSYVPTLTGTGASGTWGISITGNSAGLADNNAWMLYRGTVAEANIDTATANGFYQRQNTGEQQGLLVMNPGGSLGIFQMYMQWQGGLQFRNKTDSATWNAWKTVLTSLNYNTYALPLSGGTVTGATYFNNIADVAGDFYIRGRIYSLNAASNGWNVVFERNGGSPYITNVTYAGNTILHAGNVSTYALPIGGGTLTGALTVGTSGNTRGILNTNGDFYSYYATETSPRVQMGRDVGISGGAGIGFGGSTYALIGTGDTTGTALYIKLSAAIGTVSTSPSFQFASSGFYVGSNLALHAGNYGSYALPLSGGTVTGAVSMTANAQGYTTPTLYIKGDIRAQRDTGNTGVIYFGNSGSTYLYYDGSNYSMPTGQLDVGGNRVLTAGNYSSYALPIGGGTVTGTIISNYVQGGGWGVYLNPSTAAIRASGGYGGAFGLVDGSYGIALYSVTGTLHFAFGSNTAVTAKATMDASGNFNTAGAITQASNQVLHAGNYSSYALPLGGGTVTGTTTFSQGLRIGPTPGDPNAYIITRTMPAGDPNVGNEATELLLFHSNDNANGSGPDYITLRAPAIRFQTYDNAAVGDPDASAGWNNRLTISPAGVVNSVGTLTQGGNQVLHAGNYSSYALPLSGGTLSGVLTLVSSGTAINISGQSDSFGYNATSGLGTYIKGTGGTYVYGGGRFWDGSATQVLLHSGNYNSYSPTLTGGNASGTWGINITGRGYPRRSDGNDLNFYWSGQNGQPTWLWGGSDGANMYVYNPSNFNVNSATSAGYAGSLSTTYAGGQQLNPQTYFSQSTGLKVAMTAAAGVWSDTLWINGYAGGDVLQMCALHTQRNGTPRMYISAQASNATSYGTQYEFLTGYNYASYVNPKSGGWYGSGLPGSRWGGYSVSGGEISFGDGLPNAGQMGILIDGCYVAGENNGFWSLASDNTWGSRRGMYWDGSYLNFTVNSATAYFSNALIGGNQVLHAGNYSSYSVPLGGGTMSGTLSFNQPVGLGFANGQYIKDTGSGGLVIYSCAAVNINGTSISVGGDLTVSGTLRAYANAIRARRIDWVSAGDSQYSDPYCLRWRGENDGDTGSLSWLELQMNDDSNEEFRIYGYSCTGYGCGQISGNLYHRFDASGNAWHAGNVTAYSDARVKDNVTVIGNAVDKVMQIRGVTFTRNDRADTDTRHAGVIAQEVEAVLPEVVSTDEFGMKSVAYGNMVSLLIEAIKEQQAQITELKRTIDEIRG